MPEPLSFKIACFVRPSVQNSGLSIFYHRIYKLGGIPQCQWPMLSIESHALCAGYTCCPARLPADRRHILILATHHVHLLSKVLSTKRSENKMLAAWENYSREKSATCSYSSDLLWCDLLFESWDVFSVEAHTEPIFCAVTSLNPRQKTTTLVWMYKTTCIAELYAQLMDRPAAWADMKRDISSFYSLTLALRVCSTMYSLCITLL